MKCKCGRWLLGDEAERAGKCVRCRFVPCGELAEPTAEAEREVQIEAFREMVSAFEDIGWEW